MCKDLSVLRASVTRYVEKFDPTTVTTAEAGRVVLLASAIEASILALKAVAASRAAEGDAWKRKGHRSAAEALARDTGTSVSAAKDLLEIGRRLQSQPHVDAAARRGEISTSQVSMITDAAEADPSAERGLLEQAGRSSIAVLKETCARTKARAMPDPEERRRKIHSSRSLRSWTDIEGTWRLSASGNPEDGAQIMSALAPITDQIFDEARGEGRRESPDAYAFDALVELAREAASGASSGDSPADDPSGRDTDPETAKTRTRRGVRRGAPVKLLVRVDYDTLLRGVPTGGETCELVGYGPISISAVEDLLEMGDPFVAAVLTKAKALVGVAHLGRTPTAHQQTALEWIYPSCAVEGCPAQARLQRDHRIDWAKTHVTMLDFLDLLCSHHHNLKTRFGWELVEGRGKRAFVPPDDPRHPRHEREGASHPGNRGRSSRAAGELASDEPAAVRVAGSRRRPDVPPSERRDRPRGAKTSKAPPPAA